MSRLRRSLTFANVTASIALFLALTGGVVYAADKIGSSAIAASAIKSKHVKDNSLTAKDVLESSFDLPPGPQGPTGVQGPVGPTGAAGATNVVVRQASGNNAVSVACQAGEVATGGGGLTTTPGAFIFSSIPDFTLANRPTGWFVRAETTGGGAAAITAYAICASP